MAAPSITTGTTITFSTSFLGQILSLTRGGLARPAIDSTHFGTTTARTYVPGNLHEPGSVSGTIKFDPATKPPINGAAETVTITFADATTWAASGFMTAFDVSGELEDHFTADFELKLSGDTTVT